MKTQAVAYLIFGVTLVVLFVVITVHYYSKKRREKGEEAKFKMFEDDD